MPKTCAFCEKRFVNGDRKSQCDGLEFHYDCFRCSTCRQSIKNSFFNLGNNEYRCSDCQNKLKTVVNCSQCSNPIEDDAYIEYKNEPIHLDCFKCFSCSEPLGNMLYVEHNNEPYCVSCHMTQFAQSCAVCGRAFPPGISTRKHENQYFHIECFRCFHCGQIILSKNYVVDSDQRRLCDQCS